MSNLDKLCFLCEQEGVSRIVLPDRRCDRCPSVALATGPKLLLHNAAHILTEPELAKRGPCGFCLRGNGECRIVLQPGKSDRIDTGRSVCKNLLKIQLKKAGTYSKTSPCTNIPIRCPICPPNADAVWRYNLHQHLQMRHPGHSPDSHQTLWNISNEEREHVVRQLSIKRRRTREQVLPADTRVSEAHCSTSVLRYVAPTVSNVSFKR